MQKLVVVSLGFGLSLLFASRLIAQKSEPLSDPWRERATRAELLAMADNADAKAASGGKLRDQYVNIALQARQRLAQGDLKVGDKFYLEVSNFSNLSDTVVVRSGQVIKLPGLPDISVLGVLRTELDLHLTAEIHKINLNPIVRTVPLIRLAVSGAVNAPNFYTAPMDAILSDVIIMAGGFAADVNMKNLKIRRRQDVRWGKVETLLAVDDGWTLDSLRLISGDEFVVGRRPPNRFTTAVTLISSISAVALSLVTLSRLR